MTPSKTDLELKRYDLVAEVHPLGFKSHPFVSQHVREDGKWVRYDDIKHLLHARTESAGFHYPGGEYWHWNTERDQLRKELDEVRAEKIDAGQLVRLAFNAVGEKMPLNLYESCRKFLSREGSS